MTTSFAMMHSNYSEKKLCNQQNFIRYNCIFSVPLIECVFFVGFITSWVENGSWRGKHFLLIFMTSSYLFVLQK
jgi:hypothetical protein